MIKLLHLTINRIVMDSHVVTKCSKYGLRQGHIAYHQSSQTNKSLLTVATLKGLKVKCCDVMYAYIQAPVTEKIWTTLGSEFGQDAGKKAIIVRAIYGLKSSGAAFRKHLGECMSGLGYKPCLADPDLWLKPESRKDGTSYYSYIY